MTASPEQLRLMLLEGAVKFCRQGRDGLVARNYEQVFGSFTRCRAIITELLTTMKPEPDRKLYERLSSLYLFMVARLVEASHERSVAKTEEVLKLLEYERETWVMLIEKLATAKQQAQQQSGQPAASSALLAEPGRTPSLSVAG